MTRPSAKTDFFEDIPGIGNFSFARRSMRDELRIAAEYSRLTEGVEKPTDWLHIVATWISTLSVLTVTAPPGWDIEAMDPLDQESYDKLLAVHTALRVKEDSFRSSKSANSQAARPGNGEVDGVLVPAQVQPAAD